MINFFYNPPPSLYIYIYIYDCFRFVGLWLVGIWVTFSSMELKFLDSKSSSLSEKAALVARTKSSPFSSFEHSVGVKFSQEFSSCRGKWDWWWIIVLALQVHAVLLYSLFLSVLLNVLGIQAGHLHISIWRVCFCFCIRHFETQFMLWAILFSFWSYLCFAEVVLLFAMYSLNRDQVLVNDYKRTTMSHLIRL
jgi:hypothetical protein